MNHWVSYGHLVLEYVPKNHHKPFAEWVAATPGILGLYESDGLEAVAYYVSHLYRG